MLVAINAIDLQFERSALAFYSDLLAAIEYKFTEFQLLSEYDDGR